MECYFLLLKLLTLSLFRYYLINILHHTIPNNHNLIPALSFSLAASNYLEEVPRWPIIWFIYYIPSKSQRSIAGCVPRSGCYNPFLAYFSCWDKTIRRVRGPISYRVDFPAISALLIFSVLFVAPAFIQLSLSILHHILNPLLPTRGIIIDRRFSYL